MGKKDVIALNNGLKPVVHIPKSLIFITAQPFKLQTFPFKLIPHDESLISVFMTNPLIFAIIFLGIFTQSLTGFGFALVAMPLLIQVIGPKEAAALGALLAFTGQVYHTLRYRQSFQWRAVLPLLTTAVVGIPLGVQALKQIDSALLLTILGLVVSAYALYALLQFRLPPVQHPGWAYGFGLIAGILSGAYNTGGPPIVIYATCRGWPPDEFKANLQGMFLVISITAIFTHALNHAYTPAIMQDYLLTLPFLALGLLAGRYADRFVQPVIFRRLVLWLLLAVGLSLIF